MAAPAQTRFEPGQLWSYKARKGEEDSQLLVLAVDPKAPRGGGGPIVHVMVEGVRLKVPGGTTDVVHHMPFTAVALAASVEKLDESEVELPEFEEEVAAWREAARRGEAGAWDHPVGAALTSLERAFNPERRPDRG